MIDFLLLQLAGDLVVQPNKHLEGRGIVDIPLLAFLHAVFGGITQRVIDKVDDKVAAVIGHRRDVLEHGMMSFVIKSSKDFFCTSIRLGISSTSSFFANDILVVFPAAGA